jgi:hypothetical protein
MPFIYTKKQIVLLQMVNLLGAIGILLSSLMAHGGLRQDTTGEILEILMQTRMEME